MVKESSFISNVLSPSFTKEGFLPSFTSVLLAIYVFFLLCIVGYSLLDSPFLNFRALVSFYSVLVLSLGGYLLSVFGFVKSRILLFLTMGLVGFLFLTQVVPASFFLIFSLVLVAFSGAYYGKKIGLFLASVGSFFYIAVSLSFLETPPGVVSLFFNMLSFFFIGFVSSFVFEHMASVQSDIQKLGRARKILEKLSENIIHNIGGASIVLDKKYFISSFNKRALEVFPQLELDKAITEVNFSLMKWLTRSQLEHQAITIEQAIDGKWFEILFTPLKDGEMTYGYHLFVLDITERKISEKRRQQKEKMEVLGSLSASIAHEIRNPLASISGGVQMLSQSTNNTEKNKLLSIMKKEVVRLNDLVTHFLDYSRDDKLEFEAVNISQVLEEILAWVKFNKTLPSSVKQTKIIAQNLFIEGDISKLKQAFINVIVNAYQAMDETSSPELIVEAQAQKGWVVVKVSDNGCGIQKEEQEKIFDPFYTNKLNGTGLGLAISHKIFLRHRCKVFVNSDRKKGTSFVFQFPVFKYLFPEERSIKTA